MAVLLVVLYHADIGPFSGGYIGVDVFFVVSGLLITSLLLTEVAASGTIHLPSFWARRARRLLPASMLVVIATLVFARMWYDPLLLGSIERDALATSAFSGNIVFAVRAARGGAGYFDADLAASPLLHFWSLAVEEQYYLVWPLLIWFLARRARRLHADLRLVIAIVWVASLVACIVVTDRSQPWAFYSLPTRAWELATGAAIAIMLPSVRRLRRPVASLLVLFGIVGVFALAVVYDVTTRFPGVAALGPVAATAAILIGSSRPGRPSGIVQLLGSRPMLWIGQRSYAIYLWHWPVLILAAAHWGPLSDGGRVVAIAVAFVLAAMSFALVENPLRHAVWLRAAATRSLAFGAALLLAGALVAGGLLLRPPRTSGGGEAAAVTLPSITSTPTSTAVQSLGAVTPTDTASTTTMPAGLPLGSETTLPSATTTTAVAKQMDPLVAAGQQILEAGLLVTEVPSNLEPSLADVRSDQPQVFDDGCVLEWGVQEPKKCVYGDPGASRVIAILGDSHAAQWFAALQKIALTHDYRLLYFSKLGCPPSEQPLNNNVTGDCNAWRDKAIAAVVASNPRLIILTGYHYDALDGSGNGDGLWREGMTKTMTALGDDASRVLILGDTPTQFVDVAQCLATHLTSVGACNSQRDYAVREGRLQIEQEVAAQFGAHAVDTSDWLCTPVACPVIVGNTLLYRDRNHITNAAAELLWPLLDQVVAPLMQR